MRATLQRCGPSSFLSALSRHKSSSLALSSNGTALTYGELSRIVLSVGSGLKKSSGDSAQQLPLVKSGTPAKRIAFLTPPACSYATTLLSSWVADLIAVPLSPLFPPHAREKIVKDCVPSTIVTAAPFGIEDLRSPYGSNLPSMSCLAVSSSGNLHQPLSSTIRNDAGKQLALVADAIASEQPAMLIYTSGTTGAPKGVVWTHAMVDYQVTTLSRLWRWSENDRILNVLPLHHVHGIVNVLLSALYSGAYCEMMDKFSARDVWNSFRSGDRAPTVFMAVPTIYQRLIQFYDDASESDKFAMRKAASSLRLFVCGSAALSTADLEAWERISGHGILERYGMTETGMLLSNPYDDRQPASLGIPLPGVEAKVISADSKETVAGQGSGVVDGVLCVRGRGVFSEYWNRPDETADAFDDDGWFYTGDVVRMDAQSGRCSMLGRESTDFISTGGYKVSALEIEGTLAQNEGVATCAVVGVDDEEFGELIVGVIVPKSEGSKLAPSGVQEWLSQRLPRYKVPRRIVVAGEDFLPRNALGKIQKKVLSRKLVSC